MVTAALTTEAPEGSITVPWMVPALPSDWPRIGLEPATANAANAQTPRILFILLVFNRIRVVLSHSYQRARFGHRRAGKSHQRTASGTLAASPPWVAANRAEAR